MVVRIADRIERNDKGWGRGKVGGGCVRQGGGGGLKGLDEIGCVGGRATGSGPLSPLFDGRGRHEGNRQVDGL